MSETNKAVDISDLNPEIPRKFIKGVILECVVGSTVHGTHVTDGLEDLDLMAVALETPRSFIGFTQTDTWVERTKPEGVRSEAGDVDRTIYGLRKFLSLALRGNPTILLAFFVPPEFTKIQTPIGRELQALYPLVVSKQVMGPFRGYMKQQHERLLGLRGQRNVTRPELVDAYGYDTKYAGHIIRLGKQGEEILRTGRLTLPMPEADRELCVAVRTGKYTLPEVSNLITVAEMARARKIPGRKVGRAWVFVTADLLDFVRQGEAECPSTSAEASGGSTSHRPMAEDASDALLEQVKRRVLSASTTSSRPSSGSGAQVVPLSTARSTHGRRAGRDRTQTE
jgi:hypothetical protein